jgi:GT2 family glycosyltransferase
MEISVIVPAYNAARTVAATLDAILAQTSPAREIIVVDDGSKDDTRGALEPYRDRVRIIHQVNSGVSASRNRGVTEAAGEWLAFCDADDLWDPDKLRVASAVLEAWPDAELLFHDYSILIDGRIVEERGTHSRQTLFPIFKETSTTLPDILTSHRAVHPEGVAERWRSVATWFGSPYPALMLGNFVLPSTVMIRRRTFDSIGGFDSTFRYAEDTEFFLRLGKVASFLWADAALTAYRRTAGTLLTGNMMPTILNSTRAVEAHCLGDPAILAAYGSAARKAVGRRYARLAYFYLADLQRREAGSYARRAIGLYPWQQLGWTVLAASLLPPALLRLARGRGGKPPVAGPPQ